MAFARPEYDPNRDPGNFPLAHWDDLGPGLRVLYMPQDDTFIALDGLNPQCWGHVPVRVVQMVAGIGRFARPGAFPQSTEEAVLRFFLHEGFLRSLDHNRKGE